MSIIKHPAIRKKSGGARKLDADEMKALKGYPGGGRCDYSGCKEQAERAIGIRSRLLCEYHYQKLRSAK